MKIISKLCLIAIITLITFMFTACPDGGGSKSGGGGSSGGKQQQPTTVEVKIPVPSTPAGLNNPGKQITIVYPSSISATRRNAMTAKLTDVIALFDEFAKIDPFFKDRTNALLNRNIGLKITVRVTTNLFDIIAVENNQLIIGTFWLEHPEADAEEIAYEIADIIIAGDFVF